MLIFFILLVAIMAYRCKIRAVGFDCDYLSVSNTTSVKGIFAVLVMFSHIKGYLDFGNGFLDTSYVQITGFLGQTIVALFFFYSGYGIMEGVKKKPKYFNTFIEGRLVKTLFHFDLAVMLYYLMCVLVIDYPVPFTRLVGALIGIASIHNSNWFVFCTLILYVFVFFMFRLFKNRHVLAILGVVALCFAYIFIAKGELSYWWYDTVLCMPLGLIYSRFKNKIEPVVQKNNLVYFLITAAFCALFVLVSIWFNQRFNLALAILKVIFFVIGWVLISMKVTFNNKILNWLGTHSFSIYIIQRIPMTLLKELFDFEWNRYAYTALAFALTFVLSYLFSCLLNLFDRVFFPKKA